MNGKQLKNSILQWAIQGKLVPQDPNDEPASVLLEKIRAEKARLVKEGKLKKKDLEVKPIAEDEIPFEIPKGWEWVSLSMISLDSADGPFGSNLKREHYTENKEVRIIQLSNIGEEGWRDTNTKYTTFEHLKSIERSEAFPNDIIIAKMMPAGRAIICPDVNIKYVLSSDAVRFDFFNLINRKFLYYAINSNVFKNQVYGEVQGITRVRTSLSKLRTYLIPLPPLAEQCRIVAKIEELMPLVEKYGAAQNALDEWNKALPEKLKKSILQEAIQGRLVQQDPVDEPASVLLEHIREEKKRLVKEGKLKKKDLEVKPVEEDEIPFEIPESWEWCRIGEITQSYIGLTYKPSDVTESGTIVLRSSNIKDGRLILDDLVRVSMPISNKLWVEQNDIIICARNGSKKLVGKSAIIDEVKEPMTFGAFMAICKTSFYEYVYVFLQSDLFYSQLRNVSGTTTINQLTQNSFNGFLIPLPPLSEQRRIVAKIEELFGVIKS